MYFTSKTFMKTSISLCALLILGSCMLHAQTDSWKMNGNSALPDGSFIGTIDANPVSIKTANQERLHISPIGEVTLRNLTGSGPAVIGVDASGTVMRMTDPAADSLFDCSVKLWKANGNFLTPDCFIGSTNQAALRMVTAGQDRMRITDIGRVGIATARPKGQFQVGDLVPTLMDQSDNGNGAYQRLIGFNTYLDGMTATYHDIAPAGFMRMENGVDDLQFVVAPAGSGGQAIPANAGLMALDPSGSLGIGTTQQQAQLHLYRASGVADIRIQSGQPGAQGSLQFWAGPQGNAAWHQAQISAGQAPGTGGRLLLGINPVGSGAAMQTQVDIDRIRARFSGKLGIGMEVPANDRAAMDGSLRLTATGIPGSHLRIGHDGNAAYLEATSASASSNSPARLLINGGGQSTEFGGMVRMNGNVGIGTAQFHDPQNGKTYRLSVDGLIRAREVRVYSGWADYVFAEDYALMPLSEVAAYIDAHGHLPGIPSAAEVEQAGLELGDMQAKMMAKIEELTLHLIRLEKENGILKQQMQELQK